MNRTEVIELIRNGENSGVEFKRDNVRPESLAKERSALRNFEGGVILLGVEDDGTISGLKNRDATQRLVMEVAHPHVQPEFIPVWYSVVFDNGVRVGIIRVGADRLGKPYKAKRGSNWVTFAPARRRPTPASRRLASFAVRVWALRENLTGADAWYVALAEALGGRLVMLNRKLARADGPRCAIIGPPHSGTTARV